MTAVADAYSSSVVRVVPGRNLLISDRFTHLVRIVACTTGLFYGQKMTAGHIYTVAGGGTEGPESGIPARDEKFEGPLAVASDPAGDVAIIDGSGAGTANLVLADESRVRVVAAKTGTFYGQHMTVGDIYTVAGGGTQNAINGTPALKAKFGFGILQVAVDPAGNLLAGGYSTVFMVAERVGSYYGEAQRMTTGFGRDRHVCP